MATTAEKQITVRGLGKLPDGPHEVPVNGMRQLENAHKLGIVRSIRAYTQHSRQEIPLGRDNIISIRREKGTQHVCWSLSHQQAIEEGVEIRIRYDA